MTEIGLIEGYWGPPWPTATRLAVLELLEADLDYYTFGPKGCADLRRKWTNGLSKEVTAGLCTLGEHCQNLGITFGVMISPLGFMNMSTADLQEAIKKAGRSLEIIHPEVLIVAFDDMQEEALSAPRIQAQIAEDLFERSGCKQKTFCPSAYSSERLARAATAGYGDYLAQVSDALSPDTPIFWTGERSINNEISEKEFSRVSEIMGRAPVIWWNFPANDGHGYEDRLRFTPRVQGLREIRMRVESIHFNPMNEGFLSVVGLTASINYVRGRYGTVAEALEAAMVQRLPHRLRKLLAEDIQLLEATGRDLPPAMVARLVKRYGPLSGSAYARELMDWLQSRDNRGMRQD